MMASNSIFPKKILKLRRLFPSFAFLLDSCLVPTHHGHPKWYLTLMNTLIETKWKLEQHEDFVWETSRQSRKREMLFEEYFKLHHFWIETKLKKRGQATFWNVHQEHQKWTPPSLFPNEEKRIESNRLKSIQKEGENSISIVAATKWLFCKTGLSAGEKRHEI